MIKIIYLDCETTGLHPVRDYMHQLSGIVEFNGIIQEEFDIKMKPGNIDQLPDTYVTPVGGITKAMMLGPAYITQNAGFIKFKTLLQKYINKFDPKDKFFICGYNCQQFDMQFLRQLFAAHEDAFFGAWFYSHSLDVMILAGNALKGERAQLTNFKLETVAKYLGVQVSGEGYHDALADIHVTRRMYKILGMY